MPSHKHISGFSVATTAGEPRYGKASGLASVVSDNYNNFSTYNTGAYTSNTSSGSGSIRPLSLSSHYYIKY